ncbi:hypothetical protein OH807_00795 [Kitasatospora sp. NBC_01560]|uniref:hypothetical protein n=1 Tax=Kitasatospora sp. NBC_01560 TaxID=2975965 RepID=UPI00386AAC8C
MEKFGSKVMKNQRTVKQMAERIADLEVKVIELSVRPPAASAWNAAAGARSPLTHTATSPTPFEHPGTPRPGQSLILPALRAARQG